MVDPNVPFQSWAVQLGALQKVVIHISLAFVTKKAALARAQIGERPNRVYGLPLCLLSAFPSKTAQSREEGHYKHSYHLRIISLLCEIFT